MTRALLLLALVAGCGGPQRRDPPPPAGDELTLYRDRALVQQRLELAIAAAGPTTVTAQLAAGVDVEDVMIVDRGGLAIRGLRGTLRAPPPVTRPAPAPEPDPELEDLDEADPCAELDEPEVPVAPAAPPPGATAAPTELVLDVDAPRPGRYAVVVAYVTDRVPWEAAYTMTTTPARDQVTLRGAIAIRNTSGIAFRDARVFVVDAELGAWRTRIADRLGARLGGASASTTPLAEPRALGRLALGPGEARIELVPGASPRPMRSVLVYDPVGTALDHTAADPLRTASLGTGEVSPEITESFEIQRDPAATAGLPAGTVRLLERARDGSLLLLGEARLFDAATRVAAVDTIPIGVAEGVTGHRERRELTVDDDHKRLVEEFVLTIDNQRDHPVDVVLREHLYRGQNWTLAYQTGRDPRKEGPQQISLRTLAPARGKTRVLYVVVYTWP